MFVPNRIGRGLGRRQSREKLATRKVARERALQRAVERPARDLHDELPVVPSQGDLICFNAAIHPC
ncbi:hypothetical protein QI633_06150 [Nocardioides sp. QY071]|uniref:hypothetical protein n=1 Tax=Nocardioides sp. QY071 TaxID=3044187 RepID=UPI00249BA804|nr:hypothetical protein [Nocardioides sp. QY071]WGY03340.1 hypothetical protein QI633_06150 [Nocardioides sp. QY071]